MKILIITEGISRSFDTYFPVPLWKIFYSMSGISPWKKVFLLGKNNISSWKCTSHTSGQPQHMISLVTNTFTLLCCSSLLT